MHSSTIFRVTVLVLLGALAWGNSSANPFMPEGHAGTGKTTESTSPSTSLLPPALGSSWALSPPTIDGTIDPVEWASASTNDISFSASPVIMYLMNDGTHLYIAIDNQSDTSLDLGDIAALIFDDEGGSLGDGTWNAAVCPSTEGGIGVGNLAAAGLPSDVIFQGFSGAGSCTAVAAAGVIGSYSIATGHMVYEMSVDLTTSELHAGPGDSFGAFVGSTDTSLPNDPTNFQYSGATSIPMTIDDPSTYQTLTLATLPCVCPMTNTLTLSLVAALILVAGMVGLAMRASDSRTAM